MKELWKTLIAPVLVGVVLAYLAGRIVIQVSGFQVSIGLTILITLIFFIVIVLSFFLGFGYIIFLASSLIFRTEMPLVYRIATSFLLKPGIWLYTRLFMGDEDREADRQDLAEAKDALTKYHERIDKIRNEPPTQSAN